MTTIPTGRFVWFEYVSSDANKAQGFFGELFNWTTKAMPMPQGGEYTMIALKDDPMPIGGYPPLPAPHSSWVTHLQVSSTKDSAAKVKSLGGKVLVDPIEMGGMGTYALVADPLGATFALWQPNKVDGTSDFRPVDGAFCWNELACAEPEKAAAFYQAIGGFGLDKTEMPGMGTYYQLTHDGKPRAGIMKSPMPGAPTAWLPYVRVASADKTVDKAKRLGATVRMPATDIPNVGRFAIFTDPQGAAIGILQP